MTANKEGVTSRPSSIDMAEQKDSLSNDENGNGGEKSKLEIASQVGRTMMDAKAVEEWLTCPLDKSSATTRRDLLVSAAYHLNNRLSTPPSPVAEARSSISSPGKTAYRERLRRRLIKSRMRNLANSDDSAHGNSNKSNNSTPTSNGANNILKKLNYGRRLEVEAGQNGSSGIRTVFRDTRCFPRAPPPPPSTPPPQQQPQRKQQQNLLHKKLQKPQQESSSDAASSSGLSIRGDDEVAILFRLSRQLRMGRRGGDNYRRYTSDAPESSTFHTNRIRLHIYDLIASETVVQLPWGCGFPIGRCFNMVNSGLHSLGTGAYHVGVEINGIEYAFGANDIEGSSGVFSCIPKHSPGYQFRTTIDFGERPLVRKAWVKPKGGDRASVYREVESYVDGREVIKEMAREYMGRDYDLLRKNCCTFARDACLRLGIQDEEIPSWFRNLADAGAKTQDVAVSTIQPIQNMLSTCDEYNGEHVVASESSCEHENGFELIAESKDETEAENVTVVEAMESRHWFNTDETCCFRRTLSWTY